jgi:hypothetical protein
MAKLNQIIAIEKGIKSRVYSELTQLNKLVQKSELFTGFVKTYQKKDDASEDLPAEKKKVQYTVGAVLDTVQRSFCELMDVTARKDFTNSAAKADLKVDGQVLVKDVPVTYLLFLEKQLTDIRTFIGNLPILDDSEDWDLDTNTQLYKTDVVQTHRTKKVQKPIVLYDATAEHPAQTQLISEDILVGYWNSVKHSGAIPAPEKTVMFDRVDKLLKSVKEAREFANITDEVTNVPCVGEVIFSFLRG